MKPLKKAYTLAELIVVVSIVAIISITGIFSYKHMLRKTVESVLTNAVMINVELIDIYYANHGVWVTEAEPGNQNLTTDEELKRFGLCGRNLSNDFMMRVFSLDGYPHVIAREQIGSDKFGIEVSYHFKTRELIVSESN
ncbi:MAG: prepilin-type N-terminal cleavage/methylation domain-containing protein [Candidatus Delongbacteria bacterium]|nr:prepilin-type N-terminal cleavage/methylation domain-containing protein [Candidatus Delongbacteria bacterium]MBN2836534.1 prepilin-type N-terminal cleavage/methylation domain-containing protein [Candidatus Delongbacteria bacterium]